MKMKKKTKVLLTRVLVILLCIMMLVPVVANIVSKPTGQELLMNELLKSQIEAQKMEEAGYVEGNYLVTEVASADTLKLLWNDEERTAKLIGIKADKGSLEKVREMVEAKILSISFDLVPEDEDGNLLVYAYLENGEFLNEKLLREGLATVEKDPENTMFEMSFESAEQQAKTDKVGIWAEEETKDQ